MSSTPVISAVQSCFRAQRFFLNRRDCARLLFAASLAAGVATAAAQSTPIASQLTIDQITEVVLQHNTDFAAAARSRDAATAAVRSARALPNPRLEIASGDNALRPASAAVAGRVETRGVAQLIENPFLRSARIDAAAAGSAAAGHELTSVQNNLVAEVRLRAFEALLRLEEEIAAREAVRLLEQIRDRVKLRVDTGEAPRFELIKADAEIISARQRQVSAAIKAEQAFITLNRLAAGRLPEKWSIAGRLADEAQPMVLEEIMQQALNKSPELAVLRSLLERADASLTFAKSGRLPGVELRYQELRDPEIRQTMTGVAIQIPLLDQRQGPVAEAAAERLRAQTRLDGAILEMRQRVLLAWKSYEMARAAVDALGRGAIPEAEAALRVAEAAYRFGERGILEVLDAQRVLRSVRADLIQARFELQAARISLDRLAARYIATAR